MAQHYYSENPITKSEPFTFRYDLGGHIFSFTSDAGVFSKKEIDFGTKVLLDALEIPESAERILDVGCGYGAIGMFCAYYYPKVQVDMLDINVRAVELSKKNLQDNHIKNAQVYQSNLLAAVQNKAYDVVISNPPIRTGKENIFRLYEQAYEALNADGFLWIVIQKKQGAPSTMKKLEEMFQEVDVVAKKKGYFIIKAKK